jgi:foldase protein PrsA
VAGKGKGSRGPAGRGGRPKGPGKTGGSPAPKTGSGSKPIWLVVFAVVLVAIFVVFAVAQGIGSTSVPDGDAAIVKSAPEGMGSISEAEAKRAVGQQIAAAASAEEGKKAKKIKPGSKKYEELKTAAMGELLDQIWLAGEAEELGITVTPKQIEAELKTIKEQNFPTEKSYKEFLEKSHFNQEDVDKRVELQILSTEIQEKVSNEAKPATNDEIKAYYEKEKATQFTTPASRDVRVIVNKDQKKVEEAQELIEAGNQSAEAWKEAAEKFSSDPTTKTTGGLQKGITEEFVKGELKKAIFGVPTGQLSDAIKFETNYLLVEPTKITPEKAKTLAEVKGQISQTLNQQNQEKFFQEFVTEYQTKWTSRTFCASDYLSERCSNFKGTGHPASAPAACYEADPKVPAEECPAPVTQTTPALPGSVTPANPKGDQHVQRPRPVETAKGGKGTEAVQEAIEGAAQEGAEAAPEGAEAPAEGTEEPSGE